MDDRHPLERAHEWGRLPMRSLVVFGLVFGVLLLLGLGWVGAGLLALVAAGVAMTN